MKRWAVHDPLSQKAVVIEAPSINAAAAKGIEWLAEQNPDYFTCEHCETVTLREVDVWPLDETLRWAFEVQDKLVKLGTKANPE